MVVRATRPSWAQSALVLMDERGIDVAGAAAAVGLSRRALADRLSGRTRPLTGELISLAQVLDVPIGVLLGPVAHRRRRPPAPSLITARDRRLYRAAAQVDPGPSLRTVAATQSYVHAVVASSWWSQTCSSSRSVLVCGCGGGSADSPAWHAAELTSGGLEHRIHLPRWARRPLTVLHEMAHVAAEPIVWARPHGPQFVRLWVDLVDEFLGEPQSSRLRAALRNEGVSLASRHQVTADRNLGLAELGRLLPPATGVG
ncbi:MAG TPA: helix-turn-helix domain-containing protein [Acidimicrobiales bacterium]|nr:helix-turn-helix domain-containing protein [Acidimicrobiales bacterium]